MGRQQSGSVVGTVIVTMCVTSVMLVGGWVGYTKYLAPGVATPVQEVAAEEAPAPRRRAPRVAKTDGGRAQEGSSTDLSSVGATVTADSGAVEEPGEEGDGLASVPAEVDAKAESQSAPVEAIAQDEGDAPGDARGIMEESQRRGEAKFYQYDGQLQSFDAKGKVSEKRWRFDRIGSNGRSKAVLRFTTPAEVKGVALLIFNHPERASDQWMWTPAIERDRRIALQDRSTRFFGTDFSFEDLEERDVDQYDYAMLGNDVIDGAACWKIQTTPKASRSSHYSRSIAWIRKDNYVMARLDNFVKDEVVKRLTNSSIENIQGIWTARQLEMADLNRGTRTRLTLQEVRYNVPVKEGEFTLEAIRH